MTITFEVIDLRSEVILPTTLVEAASPEEAVGRILGIPVYRGGGRKQTIVARVYWTAGTTRSMVRLYAEPAARQDALGTQGATNSTWS